MEHTYNVEGMHCQSCVTKIESALKAIPEITKVEVSLNPPKAEVIMEKHVDIEILNAAAHKAGKYKLSEKTTQNQHGDEGKDESLWITYYPLILISAYLIGGVAVRAISSGNYDISILSDNFMGGFFIIFSFFKFLNLKGFAEAYSTYDVIAKRFYFYGFIYPFIELCLGAAYLIGVFPYWTNIITVVVMGISSIGVAQSLLKKSKIECACLGTIFKLPMTKITLFEDALMVGMALMMIYAH